MTSSTLISILSKFRGCLIGSHIGDCLGAPFEGDYPVSKSVLTKYMEKLLDVKDKTCQILPYTDDTAMTLGLGRSLVEKKSFDALDMSKKFTEEYFHNPRRGYGENVVNVFHALANSDYANVFGPAKLQFGGSGSYGNGAAMRIAPAALFSYDKRDQLLEIVKGSSFITHTHQYGYNGAILQSLAIDQALRTNSNSIDPVVFVNNLLSQMEKIEQAQSNPRGFDNVKPFCSKLQKIKESFENEPKRHLTNEAVVSSLGNSVSAHGSVPTAIYSFLRSLEPLDDFKNDNPFVRAIYFSVSLGGDTDTIAAMAGSIAGAYHGEEMIPEILQNKCESLEESRDLANELYTICCES